VLDCKSPVCSGIAKNAPKTLEHLCSGCESHFEKLKNLLDKSGVDYIVDPSIVRGLDYYTGTVFEFTVDSIGAQSTVCGGGRYDGLLSSIGGPEMPAVGFGMGITRLIQALKDEDLVPEFDSGCDIYIAPLGENASEFAFVLSQKLRSAGVSAETDVCGRSLKAQMKYADKTKAKFVIVLGDNEIAENQAELRDMRNGERVKIDLSVENIIDRVK
jgi:histidyl-tRNA synthetase